MPNDSLYRFNLLWRVGAQATDRIVTRLNQRKYPESAAAYPTALRAGHVVNEIIDVAVRRIHNLPAKVVNNA